MHRFLLRLQGLIFYSIVLFIPTQFGRHFWPVFSHVSGIRVDYLSPTIYFTDVLIGSLFVMLYIPAFVNKTSKFSIYHLPSIIYFFISKLFNKKIIGKRNMKNGQLFIVVVVFTLLLGIAQSKNPFVGVYSLVKLFEFGFFGWYVSRYVKSKKDFLSIIFIFSFGVCFESLLAIAQFITQASIGGIFYFFGERTFFQSTPGIAITSLQGHLALRSYGTFSHPNVLAGYLVIAMTIVGMNNESRIRNYGKACILLFGTIALVLTMSRIVILVWAFLVCVYLVETIVKKNKTMIHYSLFIILFIISVGSIVASPLRFRFSDFRLTDETVVVREQLLQAGLIMVEKNPFVGVGLNNFLPNLPFVLKPTNESLFSYLQPVHNIYMLILAETGIIGFSFFVWFLLKTWRKLKSQNSNLKTTTQSSKPKNSSIHYSLFIILFLGLFDHYFLTLQQGQLLTAFVLGLCWSRKSLVVYNNKIRLKG